MSRPHAGTLAVLGFVVFAAVTARAEPKTKVVAVGSNLSLDRRLAPLRYAASDAEKFARTAEAVDLVSPLDVRLGQTMTVRDFKSMLEAVASEMNPPSGSAEPWRFVFYFSGHADDRGLHFSDGFLPREQLHAMLDRLTAKTKIIVIDSCFAGSIAAKGVEQAPAFDLPRLDLDDLSGTIFLTASSSRDLAYESDELGGSIFTHYLVGGMRGRGDANADGIVTIDELYQYVYREMRLRALTAPGAVAQRPEIHADIKGSGALVIARPRTGKGSVILDPGIMGTIHVASLTGLGSFDAYSDGRDAREIPLPEGSYRAVIRRGTRIGQASFHVGQESSAQLLVTDFTWHDMDGTPGSRKGGSLATIGMTGVASLRIAADRAKTRGPQIELISDLDRAYGTVASTRIVLITSAYQAGGSSSDSTVETYGAKGAIGFMVGPTGQFNPRLLMGLGQFVEYQTWKRDDEERTLAVMHPSVLFGLNVDLGKPEDGGRSLSFRYDADMVKDQESKAIRRRDVYLLGVSFNP